MKDENLKQLVGSIIRTKRRSKFNYSLEQLALKTGLDWNNLGRIERGEQLPSSKTLIILINTLNIDFLPHKVKTDKAIRLDEDNF